ncbi:hypothetical protein IFM89_016796 [Coptis chinensis]|uniref:Uncharacterized protein n=1 Tax=Coptis chinensis TaxID=261450 RepID=A0A835IVQ1_9MAGN|nr:hypothetical protein IFM89_016796 [Coptis chinensis]
MDPGENSDSVSDMGVDETSDTPMEVNNTQDSSVERIGRGAVQCKRITKMREGELLNVQYNEDGQRIGEGGKDLASYSGLLAESRISIVDYENWHAVGDEVRDLLWDTIKAKFNLTEDEKKGVVSDIASAKVKSGQEGASPGIKELVASKELFVAAAKGKSVQRCQDRYRELGPIKCVSHTRSGHKIPIDPALPLE